MRALIPKIVDILVAGDVFNVNVIERGGEIELQILVGLALVFLESILCRRRSRCLEAPTRAVALRLPNDEWV